MAIALSLTNTEIGKDRMQDLSDGPKSLLILDDDAPLRNRLARAMESRGFEVITAETVSEGISLAQQTPPAYAVLDMRLAAGSGLDVVAAQRAAREDARIILLRRDGRHPVDGGGKAGAVDYLPKTADADTIAAALLNAADGGLPPPPENPMPADRVRWEHIQRVYEQCGRNVSETARRLKMHRRTLQRILNKYAPPG